MDTVLAIAVILLPAIFGIVVEAAPKGTRDNGYWRAAVIVFGVCLTGLTGFQVYRANTEHAGELATQKQNLEEQARRTVSEIKEAMRLEDVRNAEDMGFLKGQLATALARQPTPLLDVNKLASVLSQHVKEETGVLSSKQLVDATLKFCQALRLFESDYEQQYDRLLDQFQNDSRQAANNPVMMEQAWQKYRQADVAARNNLQYDYRTKYMARAMNPRSHTSTF